MSMQSADDRATEISAAFQLALSQRMNEAERQKLAHNIEDDLKPADIDYIVRDMLAKPDWFPEEK